MKIYVVLESYYEDGELLADEPVVAFTSEENAKRFIEEDNNNRQHVYHYQMTELY